MYYIHCIFFGRNVQKSWTRNGFSAWSRAVSSIQLHECSEPHIEATLKFKLRQSSLPILPLLKEKHQQEKSENREIVKCLIDITLFLARNSLAFRGHRENVDSNNQGNFINLVKLIAKYSPYLSSYVFKLQNLSMKPE